MSKADKLLSKLKNGTISAAETRTLLKKLGWVLDRTSGSHERWIKGSKGLTIATHTKELPRYQVLQILKAVED